MAQKNDLETVDLYYYHILYCIYTCRPAEPGVQRIPARNLAAGKALSCQDGDFVSPSDDYRRAPRRRQLFTNIFWDDVKKYSPSS